MTKTSFRIRPSRSGKILLFLAAFLLFAAQNTGNNLLYLMSSCFIACIIWAGAIAVRNLSGLSAEIIFPDYCLAGEQVAVRCKIQETAGRQHFLLGLESDFVQQLQPHQSVFLRADFIPEKRGSYLLKELKVFSCYPVDLFLTYLEIEPEMLKVGPRPATLNNESISRDPAGAVERQQTGKEGDYWMQMPYQEGADASLINWAISARSSSEWVLIRSVRCGLGRRFCFDFSGLDDQSFEDSLMLVAGLVVKLRKQNNEAYVWGETRENVYDWLSTSEDLIQIIHWLAGVRLETIGAPPAADVEPVCFAELTGKKQ